MGFLLGGGGSSAPAPYVPPAPQAATPPTVADPGAALAASQARQRAMSAAGAGFSDTDKTTAKGGDVDVALANKTLLGQ